MSIQRIKELEAENAELDKLAVSRWNIISDLQDVIGRLRAELAAVRAELAECRQQAFENGRETERAAGWGELGY